MRNVFNRISLMLIGFALISCETTIHPDLEDAESLVTVDAWVNNKMEPQIITVSLSQPYFENTLPPGDTGADVTVENLTSDNTISFAEVPGQPGSYGWTPAIPDEMGAFGDQFRLLIQTNGESYEAFSVMGRVPVIDSITFTFEEGNEFLSNFYIAEFWAREPAGSGDTYWIRASKNSIPLNKPSEISLAFDAGFSQGGNFDGVTFIPPIRTSINPFDQDEEDNFLPPYLPGDSVHVELHSISLSAFQYLNQVIIQTNRPGGFGELFSPPLANVPTNIANTNADGRNALGFFNVSAVSTSGKRLIE